MSKEAMKLALELAQEGVEIHSPNSPEYKVCSALIEALANHCEDNLDMVKQERPDGGIGGCATCGAAYADQIIKQEQGEPVYHLRSYGDVTKDELVRYIATGDINATPQPAQKQGEPVGVTYKEVADAMNSLMMGDSTQLQIAENLGNKKLYTTPQQHTPLTDEQRFDLLTQFEPHKNKWEAPAILIDMVEAAHGIKE